MNEREPHVCPARGRAGVGPGAPRWGPARGVCLKPGRPARHCRAVSWGLGSLSGLGKKRGGSQGLRENAAGAVRLTPGVRTKSKPEIVCSSFLWNYRQGFGKTDFNWDFRAQGALSAQRYRGSRWPPWWPRSRREIAGGGHRTGAKGGADSIRRESIHGRGGRAMEGERA